MQRILAFLLAVAMLLAMLPWSLPMKAADFTDAFIACVDGKLWRV